MSFTLRQIRYFLAAVDAGKISQAAIDLNVSQSAITTALKELEQRLGVSLFERHPHGVSLTQAGLEFIAHARHISAAVEEALRSPRQYDTDVDGELHLAVTYTIAGYFLPQHLLRFSRRYPSVKLRLSEAGRDEIEEGIVARRFDLAVMLTSNLVNQEDIASETLLRSRRKLWLPVSHPLLTRPAITLADVADEPYVMLTVDEASNTTHRYWNRSQLTPRVIFATSSVEAVRSMVGMSTGVTILSDMVYRPWSLEGRRIEARSLTNDIPTMDAGLAWLRNAERSRPAQAFVDYLRLSFQASGSF